MTIYKELLKINEAAKLVGRSEVTIRRAIRASHVLIKKEQTKSGFNYLIYKDSLLKYFNEQPDHDKAMTSHDQADDYAELENRQNIDNDLQSRIISNFQDYLEISIKPYRESIQILKEQLGKKDDELSVKDQQLSKKDKQIDALIERNREMNVLLKGLQDRLPMIEAPREKTKRAKKEYQKDQEAVEIEIEKAAAIDKEQDKNEALPNVNVAPDSPHPDKTAEGTHPVKKKKGFWRRLLTPE